jgi:hypothetical protein
MAVIAVEAQEKGKGRWQRNALGGIRVRVRVRVYSKCLFLGFASKTRTRCQVIEKRHGGVCGQRPYILPY